MPTSCSTRSAARRCSGVTGGVRRSIGRRCGDLLLRISRLVEEVPEISELDLNPVIALPDGQGYRIVDARIKVVDGRRNGGKP